MSRRRSLISPLSPAHWFALAGVFFVLAALGFAYADDPVVGGMPVAWGALSMLAAFWTRRGAPRG